MDNATKKLGKKQTSKGVTTALFGLDNTLFLYAEGEFCNPINKAVNYLFRKKTKVEGYGTFHLYLFA